MFASVELDPVDSGGIDLLEICVDADLRQ